MDMSVQSVLPMQDTSSDYLTKVVNIAEQRGIGWPDPKRANNMATHAIYRDVRYKLDDGPGPSCNDILGIGNRNELLEHVAKDVDAQKCGICVVQNITPPSIDLLGVAWDIDPAFFAGHARCRSVETVRDEFFEWDKTVEWYKTFRDEGFKARYMHVDGLFWLPPLVPGSKETPWTNYFKRDGRTTARSCPNYVTRISYCRVHEYLYLILVDAAIGRSDVREKTSYRPTLSLMYSCSTTHPLELPYYYLDTGFDLLKCFEVFLSELWYFDYLFLVDEVILPHPFLYILASTLWQANLKYLDTSIKRISFVEIRDPNRGTNGKLHDMRMDLNDLKRCISNTLEWRPNDFGMYFAMYAERPLNSLFDKLASTIAEAKELESFLMETFQLLMSSLSVQDSQISIEQARRGTIVTWLAFIYVPLSFVTGIFGMNIKEINGSPISFWVCFAALGVVIAVTAVGFAVYKSVNALRKRNAQRGGLISPLNAISLASTLIGVAEIFCSIFRRRRRAMGKEQPGDAV